MPCFRYFLLSFLCLGLTACSNTGSVSSASMMPDYPDIITVERGGFTPEGIEYDHLNQRFLLGSFIEDKVFALAANGELTTVVDDPDVDAIIGIEAEEDRQRILAAVADPGVFAGQTSGFARVGVFDLTSGARLALVSLDDA